MEARMTLTKTDKLKSNSPSKPKWSSGRLAVTTVYQELHLLNRVQVQGAANGRISYFKGAPEQIVKRNNILTSFFSHPLNPLLVPTVHT